MPSLELLELTEKLERVGLRFEQNGTWCPRLDQLLAEVARRWEGRSFTLNKYPREWSLILFSDSDIPHHFDGDTAEEAAAKTLLWQLEQES